MDQQHTDLELEQKPFYVSNLTTEKSSLVTSTLHFSRIYPFNGVANYETRDSIKASLGINRGLIQPTLGCPPCDNEYP